MKSAAEQLVATPFPLLKQEAVVTLPVPPNAGSVSKGEAAKCTFSLVVLRRLSMTRTVTSSQVRKEKTG
jgi:hypothetical protein